MPTTASPATSWASRCSRCRPSRRREPPCWRSDRWPWRAVAHPRPGDLIGFVVVGYALVALPARGTARRSRPRRAAQADRGAHHLGHAGGRRHRRRRGRTAAVALLLPARGGGARRRGRPSSRGDARTMGSRRAPPSRPRRRDGQPARVGRRPDDRRAHRGRRDARRSAAVDDDAGVRRRVGPTNRRHAQQRTRRTATRARRLRTVPVADDDAPTRGRRLAPRRRLRRLPRRPRRPHTAARYCCGSSRVGV